MRAYLSRALGGDLEFKIIIVFYYIAEYNVRRTANGTIIYVDLVIDLFVFIL